MKDFRQGDIISIAGFESRFLIVSCNSFIEATSMAQVCPIMDAIAASPLHIPIYSDENPKQIVTCEELRLINLKSKDCRKLGSVSNANMINISDTIQGVFEYE